MNLTILLMQVLKIINSIKPCKLHRTTMIDEICVYFKASSHPCITCRQRDSVRTQRKAIRGQRLGTIYILYMYKVWKAVMFPNQVSEAKSQLHLRLCHPFLILVHPLPRCPRALSHTAADKTLFVTMAPLTMVAMVT